MTAEMVLVTLAVAAEMKPVKTMLPKAASFEPVFLVVAALMILVLAPMEPEAGRQEAGRLHAPDIFLMAASFEPVFLVVAALMGPVTASMEPEARKPGSKAGSQDAGRLEAPDILLMAAMESLAARLVGVMLADEKGLVAAKMGPVPATAALPLTMALL
jgi:hypothetical protein